ncbi:MAG: flagellar biosynthetic protein FliO [Burkholderiales bacterium]
MIGAGSLLQVVLGLALVLAMIFAAAWTMRRFNPPASQNGTLRIVGGTAVGGRERILLLEVGETWLVVGVAPGQVNSLCTLPKPEHVAAPPALEPASGFQMWLKKSLARRA